MNMPDISAVAFNGFKIGNLIYIAQISYRKRCPICEGSGTTSILLDKQTINIPCLMCNGSIIISCEPYFKCVSTRLSGIEIDEKRIIFIGPKPHLRFDSPDCFFSRKEALSACEKRNLSLEEGEPQKQSMNIENFKFMNFEIGSYIFYVHKICDLCGGKEFINIPVSPSDNRQTQIPCPACIYKVVISTGSYTVEKIQIHKISLTKDDIYFNDLYPLKIDIKDCFLSEDEALIECKKRNEKLIKQSMENIK